jgi:fucose permease
MKTFSLKAILILLGCMLINTGHMHAGIADKFKEFAGTEFNNFQGLYIMAGIIVSSLVIYILVNHFGKEEEEKASHGAHYSHHRRHQHHHRVIRKTS